MKAIVFALALSVLAATGASAAPVAPAGSPIKGDVVSIGTLFHVDYWNVRITKIEWMPGTSALGMAIDTNTEEGKGYIVLTAAIKNASKDTQDVLTPIVQVLYKDETQSDDDWRYAYRENNVKKIDDTVFQPGQGLSVRWAVGNMPKPSAENPITKIIIKPHSGNNDAGAPNIFRMLNPPVS